MIHLTDLLKPRNFVQHQLSANYFKKLECVFLYKKNYFPYFCYCKIIIYAVVPIRKKKHNPHFPISFYANFIFVG